MLDGEEAVAALLDEGAAVDDRVGHADGRVVHQLELRDRGVAAIPGVGRGRRSESHRAYLLPSRFTWAAAAGLHGSLPDLHRYSHIGLVPIQQ